MPTHPIPTCSICGGILSTTRIHQCQLSRTIRSTNQYSSTQQYDPFSGTTTYSTSSHMHQEQAFSSAQSPGSGTYNHGDVSHITSRILHHHNAALSGHQNLPLPPAELPSPCPWSVSSPNTTTAPSLAGSRHRRGPSVRSEDSDRGSRIYVYGGDDHLAHSDGHSQHSSRSTKPPKYLYIGWKEKKKPGKDSKKEYHWSRPIRK